MKSARLAILMTLLTAWETGCDSAPAARPAVTIRGHVWTVDIAMTDHQRYRGMSGRTEVDDHSGMLFIYPSPRRTQYCMRGCPVPLDIAYIDKDLRVVRMYTMDVEPDMAGVKGYDSGQPIQYVLETAAGSLRAAGVQVGDWVAFNDSVPSPAKAEEGP
jgi:uncharacterized membrane protein (UPF0127 family)